MSDGADPLSSGVVAVVKPDSSRVCVGRGVEQLRTESRAFLAFLQTPFPSRSAVRGVFVLSGLAWLETLHMMESTAAGASCFSSVSLSARGSAILSACGSTSAPGSGVNNRDL